MCVVTPQHGCGHPFAGSPHYGWDYGHTPFLLWIDHPGWWCAYVGGEHGEAFIVFATDEDCKAWDDAAQGGRSKVPRFLVAK